jgi:hypothetical protein
MAEAPAPCGGPRPAADLLLGIDIGAGSLKASLITFDGVLAGRGESRRSDIGPEAGMERAGSLRLGGAPPARPSLPP